MGTGYGASYRSGLRLYQQFTRAVGRDDDSFPRDADTVDLTVTAFLGYMRAHDPPYSSSTIHNYFAAIVHHYKLHVNVDIVSLCPRLRIISDSLQRLATLPTTPRGAFMPEWMPHVHTATAEPGLRLAVALGFHFMLRISEYTFEDGQHPLSLLTGDNLFIKPDTGFITIRLRRRKNNQSNYPWEFARQPLPADTSAPYALAGCPTRLYHAYRRSIGPRYTPHGPALRLLDGTPIRPSHVGAIICAVGTVVGARHLTPHSLRIGGATAAYRSGRHIEWIMREGGWRSSRSLLRYIRGVAEDYADATTDMAHAVAYHQPTAQAPPTPRITDS
jgi:hypothetical protein